MKQTIVLTTLTLVLTGAFAVRAEAAPKTGLTHPTAGTADDFFGITNLYTFHITIPPDQWLVMEEPDAGGQQPVPREGDSGEPDNDPPPQTPGRPEHGPAFGPGEKGPMIATEFRKGTATLEFEGQPFGAIHVRFKGHSSYRFARNSLKRSLKLDFNDLEKGRTFFGLTKLNLNNNAMDPSQMREALAYHIFRAGGVPAGRTAFARVFITIPGKYAKAYTGLYTIVEQVDERFLKTRFGAKEGMLLKPDRMIGLPYPGNDWAAYTNQAQPKGTVSANDQTRFIEFVKCLNLANSTDFPAAVADYVEVDEFLRFLALECLLSNLDSPLMTGHNYYLYLHPKTRKFTWIPWDLNEAFGVFGPGGGASEQMDLSLDCPLTNANILARGFLQMPVMKARYHEILRGQLATNFNAAFLFPLIDAMTVTIRSSLLNDPMVSLPQFEASLSELSEPQKLSDINVGQSGFRPGGMGGPDGPRQPRAALKAFINQRVTSARLQLEGKTNGYVPREIRPGQNDGPRHTDPALGPPQ